MQLGFSYAASFDAVRQAQLAEQLGFDFIGFHDTPALEPDVWITIANAVQATQRIAVGPELLIPHLRHPMVQAAAVATIEHLAPGRLYVGIGTGFTAPMAMGQRPLPWSYVRQFVLDVKALLSGSTVQLDGATTQMIHPPDFAPERPIEVQFLIAANGPKGLKVAREVGDGIIYMGPNDSIPEGFAVLQLPAGGVLLEPGEAPDSPRVLQAASRMFSLQYHLAYEGFAPGLTLDVLPYGDDWLSRLQGTDPARRHLVVHDQHTVGVNAHDAAFIQAHPDALAGFAATVAVTPEGMRAQLDGARAAGATRVSYPLAFGTDWESAMRSFAHAVFG